VRNVEADEEGIFRDRYKPNVQGIWTVTASTDGDVYYEASSSEPVLFTVEEPQDIFTVYTYGLLTTVIVITILAIWWLQKRSLKN